ncbi:YdiU family protein [Vibrio sp. YMD68]|uniref:protein adenylyltransferase SelO n=1 Tax=Vibrio sp. YMD68 TaxID=3042300 RepID=UPI00249B0BE9|nr:YdiU family protein [Vibrio sp. YMD68]WGV98657.1 YdiU family protein [Vibrio sp. YMD68]
MQEQPKNSDSALHSEHEQHSEESLCVHFDNSYVRDLEGFYQHQNAENAPSPKLIKFNHSLAQSLKIEINSASDEELAHIFSGQTSLPGANPIAQAYAGHQFGHYNPQLGDGRALLLGEVIDVTGQRKDIQLKGSGRTPYSRSGDGKAAIGPVIREYLVAEAMHALHIPTTRALAAVTTGEQIWRDHMVDGATLTRVAASHIRVGTFQFFAAQGDPNDVKRLADYTIERHYPEVNNSDSRYLELLKSVCTRQALLVSKWQLVGFIHGVMNTDNTTVSGETIDYGPCAFMDHYDPNTLFSSIDANGRYAYSNQPQIAQWNLARFAETLLPLLAENEEEAVEIATNTLHEFMNLYNQLWLDGMRSKLGLTNQEDGDLKFVQDTLTMLHQQHIDFTLFFRSLSSALLSNDSSALALFADAERWEEWKTKWLARMEREAITEGESVTLMNAHNPVYIPRNHKVEEALSAAEQHNDFQPFERLLSVLMNPFEVQPNCEEFELPAPSSFGPYRTFCGT